MKRALDPARTAVLVALRTSVRESIAALAAQSTRVSNASDLRWQLVVLERHARLPGLAGSRWTADTGVDQASGTFAAAPHPLDDDSRADQARQLRLVAEEIEALDA